MLSRLRSVWSNHHPAIVTVAIVFCGHLGWKYLQDIGIGDKGRDYPHKKIIEICSDKIKESLSSQKDKNGSKEEG